MARARNIKPGFFKNEDLAECSAFARLCFAGLWTIADRKGRLEDRPKRIKGDLFAYDSVEVEPLLAELAQWGFIARYVVDGKRLIQILAFAKHQNPHRKEKPSELPAMPGYIEPKPDSMDEKPGAFDSSDDDGAQGKPGASNPSHQDKAQGMPEASLGQASGLGAMAGGVIPADSLFSDSLIPSSLNPDSGSSEPAAQSAPPTPSTKAELWKAGKSLLSSAGMPEGQCGTFVGKLVKDYGDEVVLEAVRRSVVEQPADPASFLKATCQAATGQRRAGKAGTSRHDDFDEARYAGVTYGPAPA